jgi:hypothetical protein
VTKRCPTCFGLGYVYVPVHAPGNLLTMVLHERCGGTGRIRA